MQTGFAHATNANGTYVNAGKCLHACRTAACMFHLLGGREAKRFSFLGTAIQRGMPLSMHANKDL